MNQPINYASDSSDLFSQVSRLRVAVMLIASVLLLAVAGICFCLWRLNMRIDLIESFTR